MEVQLHVNTFIYYKYMLIQSSILFSATQSTSNISELTTLTPEAIMEPSGSKAAIYLWLGKESSTSGAPLESTVTAACETCTSTIS